MYKEIEIVLSHGEIMDYYTVVKTIKFPDGTIKNIHVHASSKKMADSVADCYFHMKKTGSSYGTKYSMLVRDKATQLLMDGIKCYKKY